MNVQTWASFKREVESRGIRDNDEIEISISELDGEMVIVLEQKDTLKGDDDDV